MTRPDVFALPERNNYVVGPELKVAGLVTDGNVLKFGEKSQNFMDIAFSGGTGSCPHLLSWDRERRDWTERGKVLHEANDASREQTQTIVLPGFVSRFRLEEREPEVATIDDAKIAFSLTNGSSITQAEYSPIRQGWAATAVLGRRSGARIQPSEPGRLG